MVIVKQNIFRAPDVPSSRELSEMLVDGQDFQLERIVSTGQATPAGQWYDQQQDEWVILLSGTACLRLEGEKSDLEMHPGDYIHIPAHCRHRVQSTSTNEDSVWLAIHYVAKGKDSQEQDHGHG